MRQLRRVLGLAVGLALGGGGLLTAVPAHAAEGACTSGTGVSVVVDARAIGGPLTVRCAPNASGTGLDALEQAGFSVTGTARYGKSFICRIDGVPGASQALALKGRSDYRESCVNTPPAGASWSYWYAPDRGSWQYSQAGAKNRTVIQGGFEGWRFQLNAGAGSLSVPGIAPRRTTSSGGASGAPTTAPPPASPSPAARSSAPTGGASLPAPAPRSGSGQSAAPTTSPSPAQPSASADPAAASDETGSSPAPWIAGAAVIALLALATLTGLRRRRTREHD